MQATVTECKAGAGKTSRCPGSFKYHGFLEHAFRQTFPPIKRSNQCFGFWKTISLFFSTIVGRLSLHSNSNNLLISLAIKVFPCVLKILFFPSILAFFYTEIYCCFAALKVTVFKLPEVAHSDGKINFSSYISIEIFQFLALSTTFLAFLRYKSILAPEHCIIFFYTKIRLQWPHLY